MICDPKGSCHSGVSDIRFWPTAALVQSYDAGFRRDLTPRVVLETKPECVRKQRGSENVITIKDWDALEPKCRSLALLCGAPIPVPHAPLKVQDRSREVGVN
jgi:hypothetical protein